MKYFILGVLISLSSFAGREGGGGAGVVCKNKQGQISSVKLLDLYEAELSDGKLIPRSNLAVTHQISQVLKKTDKYFRYDLNEQIQDMKINYLPENVTQRQPYDLGDGPVVIEDNCSVEWIAFYKDSSDVLQVVTKYYKKMSPTDQAALVIHEAVYKIRRTKINDESSFESRKIVAEFFASNVSFEQLAKLTQDMRTPENLVIISTTPTILSVEVMNPNGYGAFVTLVCYDSNRNVVERTGRNADDKPSDFHYVNGNCRQLSVFLEAASYIIRANDIIVSSGVGTISNKEISVDFRIYPPNLQ